MLIAPVAVIQVREERIDFVGDPFAALMRADRDFREVAAPELTEVIFLSNIRCADGAIHTGLSSRFLVHRCGTAGISVARMYCGPLPEPARACHYLA